MNVININIDFTKGICEKSGISVVTGDFNSTKLVFNFAEEYEGTKIFELRHINSETPTYVGEIINNEVVLVGTKEEEGQTIIYSLFDQVGDYVFEVSLYQNDSKLTSMFGYITARQEQVVIGDEIVEPYIPIFDTLILEINTKLDEMDSAIQSVANLDVDAEKVDKTTTITITKQDGTQEQTYVEDGIDGQDGQDGASLENMVIDNRDLKVTYGGETDNLGQVVPNIQVGTTTTVLPSADARVINVGTDLNPILNFEIPKGDAGAIKIRIVNELPLTGSEDTFYLVPKQESETQDMYDEYVWINNTWELVGEKQIEVDLSDYYTKSEVNALIPDQLSDLQDDSTHRLVTDTEKTTWNNKVGTTDYATSSTGGVIKVQNSYGTNTYNGFLTGNSRTYADYTSDSNALIICKGTLENVITGKDLTTKSYVDGLVGDINSALDTINGEII